MYDSDETQQKLIWIFVVLVFVAGVFGYFYTKDFNPVDLDRAFNGPQPTEYSFGNSEYITSCSMTPKVGSRFAPAGKTTMYIGNNEYLAIRDVNPYGFSGEFTSLLRNNVLYVWNANGSLASKTKMTPGNVEDYVAFATQLSNPNSQLFLEGLVDVECEQLPYNATMFNLPSNIQFTENSVEAPSNPNPYLEISSKPTE
ncbi:MAG: hypothetical protein ACOZAO_05200 [Patescibacteria group bacterium]